eukprot:8127253-Alexandrium_andersonii.AAC.1
MRMLAEPGRRRGVSSPTCDARPGSTPSALPERGRRWASSCTSPPPGRPAATSCRSGTLRRALRTPSTTAFFLSAT